MDSEVLDLSTMPEGHGYTPGGQPLAMGTDDRYHVLNMLHSVPSEVTDRTLWHTTTAESHVLFYLPVTTVPTLVPHGSP